MRSDTTGQLQLSALPAGGIVFSRKGGTRKSKADLSIERALADGGRFMARYDERRAAAKAKKK